jgi:hypothetical protein
MVQEGLPQARGKVFRPGCCFIHASHIAQKREM